MKLFLRFFTFTYLLLAIIFAGCGKQTKQFPNGIEVRDISMRLQWIPQYQFAGYIVALVKGYYADAGLNVTINPGSPDFVPLPLVASGSDTFGSAGPDTIFMAREKKIPVVALATFFQASPVGFMVQRKSGITAPHDFVGKTVGVFYGDNVETEYRALLAATGVDRKKINEVPAQFNLEPFLRGRVDVWPVYVTDQPHLAEQKGAEVRLILARDYGVKLMGDVLFTREAFIRQNPKTTQAFLNATLRGWEYAVKNLAETVKLLAEYDKTLSPDQLAFEGRETIKLLQYGIGAEKLGWNDPQAWATEQQQLLELGLLKGPTALETVFENRFVAAYYQK